MKRRTWIENCTCNDGTELIIFRNNDGCYEVSEYYYSDDGETVFTGTHEQCKAFVNNRWCEIAAACIG